MSRQRIPIDQKEFEKLCGMQCTKEEIAGFFDCSEDTIERWCHSTYKQPFAVVFKAKRARGKISLRRSQWELAKKNAAMSIWLGKQYLEQTDTVQNMHMEIEDDGLIEALAKSQNRLVFDGDMVDD